MKIGLVLPYNITKGGGVKEIVLALQAGLTQRGHKVLIITPRPQGVVKAMKGVIFVGAATDFRSPLATTSQISASIDTDEIDELLEREKFDVLHFHEPWVPMMSRQILSRSQCINVATFHAKLPETIVSRSFIKIVTPYTRSILKYLHESTAVSEAALEYVRSMTDDPVSIIPNGIDLHQFHAPRHRPDRAIKSILYIGRLEKRKGVNFLIDAFAILHKHQHNVKLIIAGDGVDRDKLKDQVEELGLQKNVQFLGFVSETQKKKLLHDADLFCSPALYGESFGIVLLEAMASGLVTVAGNNPGYSSVLQGLGSLSLVDPKNSDEFASRMRLLLNEPQLRKLWLSWARESVGQYDWPIVVGQYEAVYEAARANHA